MSERFDAVLDLLDEFGYFLDRSQVYEDIPLSTGAREIKTNILIESLHVIAIATKMVKDSRPSMFGMLSITYCR